MNLIILFTLFACALSAPLSRDISLNGVFALMKIAFQSDSSDKKLQVVKHTNLVCLKEKMKLAEHGNELVNMKLGLYLASMGAIMCLDDRMSGFETFLRDGFEEIPMPKHLECLKRRLQEFEPTSVNQGF
jgi:hypothetical protein